MTGNRKVQCKDCGGWARDVGQISHSGLCGTCSDRRMLEAREQLQARSGPIWDRYIEGTKLYAAEQRARLAEPE